jgi:hypothetical protein
VVSEVLETPQVVKPTGKGSKRKLRAVKEADEVNDEVDLLTQSFDGSKKINVREEMTRVKDKYGDLFVTKEVFEKKFKELEERMNKELYDSLTAIEEAHNERFAALEDSIKSKANNNTEGKIESNDWTFRGVVTSLVENKLANLNSGHSSEATNKPVIFDLSAAIFAVCLHCFAAGKSPTQCVFAKSSHSVLMHRRPKDGFKSNHTGATCVKVGKTNVSNENYADMRMVEGKDYLISR